MQIQNPEVGQALRDEAKLTLVESSNQNLLPNVQAVIDVTPSNHPRILCINNATTGTGSGTVYAAQANKRYKIHGFTASFVKDATCDGADGSIQWNFTQDGVTRTFCSFPVIALTAQSQFVACFFDYPIVTDVNSAISCASYTFTVGKCRRNVNIYLEEELL